MFEPGDAALIKYGTFHNNELTLGNPEGESVVVVRTMAGGEYVIVRREHDWVRVKLEDLESP